jgi:periplasmic protein TonB
VLLQVAVRENGSVAAVRLVQSSGFKRLDEAARQAVLRWRFHPAQKNGVAIADEVMVPMPFRLSAETPEQ